MTLPSSDNSPSELFAKLTSTVRPSRVVDIPRKGPDGKPVGQVAMVPLTQTELISANVEATRSARDKLSKGVSKPIDDAALERTDVYQNIAACEVLFRSCKRTDDPELKKPAFKAPSEIANAFSNDEIGVMYQHYATMRAEVGPIVAIMADDEIDAWIAALAEGGSALPLDALSWPALSTLVLSMASRLHALATDKSSPGLPADPQEESAAFDEY